jgi:hypothetical protein
MAKKEYNHRSVFGFLKNADEEHLVEYVEAYAATDENNGEKDKTLMNELSATEAEIDRVKNGIGEPGRKSLENFAKIRDKAVEDVFNARKNGLRGLTEKQLGDLHETAIKRRGVLRAIFRAYMTRAKNLYAFYEEIPLQPEYEQAMKFNSILENLTGQEMKIRGIENNSLEIDPDDYEPYGEDYE